MSENYAEFLKVANSSKAPIKLISTNANNDITEKVTKIQSADKCGVKF